MLKELWKQKREKTTTIGEGEDGKDTPASPTPFIIRLGVQSGGCSGLSYVLNIIDKVGLDPSSWGICISTYAHSCYFYLRVFSSGSNLLCTGIR